MKKLKFRPVELADIKNGQIVFWADPDKNHSSGMYVIVSDNNAEALSDLVITITNSTGSEAEVYAHELYVFSK